MVATGGSRPAGQQHLHARCGGRGWPHGAPLGIALASFIARNRFTADAHREAPVLLRVLLRGGEVFLEQDVVVIGGGLAAEEGGFVEAIPERVAGMTAITWTTTWMSSHSVSTAGPRAPLASSSTASSSRPPTLDRSIGLTWRRDSGSMTTTY
jgi:hypothetical protein